MEGVLDWGPTAGAGTRRGREEPIVLNGTYECRWQPYSKVAAGPGGELRYLAIEVGDDPSSSP